MVIAINYADAYYANAQKLNSKTAILYGADKVIEYQSSDIDDAFYNKNKEILCQKRGNGYWLWKPYFIKKTMEQMHIGEYLIYSDAGSFYINPIQLLISCMKKEYVDIMIFTLPDNRKEKIWSKRDAFILMDCDCEEYAETPQRLAGFLLIRKTDDTYRFISEWLDYAQDPRIITDQANCFGENYDGFRENRHDQTILSLLSKKYKLKCFRNPYCTISDNNKDILERSTYPQIFDLHRMPNVLTEEEVQEKRKEQMDRLLNCWGQGRNIILYGAGKNARRLISYSKYMGLKVTACVISDDQDINDQNVLGIKVYRFSELPYRKQNTEIVVTIDADGICKMLTEKGYTFILLNNEMLTIMEQFLERIIE